MRNFYNRQRVHRPTHRWHRVIVGGVLAGALSVSVGTVSAQKTRTTDGPFGTPDKVERTDWKTWLHLNKSRYRTLEPTDVRAIGLTVPTRNAPRAATPIWGAIRSAAESDNPVVRARAVHALGFRGEALTDSDRALIDKALDDSNPAIRDRAILAVGISGRTDAVPGLVALLKDRAEKAGVTDEVNDRQRGIAAIALGMIGGDDAVAALVDRVADAKEDRSVRASAAAALGYAAPRTSGAEARTSALACLWRVIGDEGARADLRSVSLIAFGRWGERASVEAIASMASDEEAMLRRSALFAAAAWIDAARQTADTDGGLGAEAMKPLAKVVRKALDDAAIRVRTAAIVVLGRLGDLAGDDAAALLAKQLEADNVMVRNFAALAAADAIRNETIAESAPLIEALGKIEASNVDQQALLHVAQALAGREASSTFDGDGAIRLAGYASLAHAVRSDRTQGVTDAMMKSLARVRTRFDRHNALTGLVAVQPTEKELAALRPGGDGESEPELANKLALLAWWRDPESVRRAATLVTSEKFPVVDRVLLIEALAQSTVDGRDPLGALAMWHDPALNFSTIDYVLAFTW